LQRYDRLKNENLNPICDIK